MGQRSDGECWTPDVVEGWGMCGHALLASKPPRTLRVDVRPHPTPSHEVVAPCHCCVLVVFPRPVRWWPLFPTALLSIRQPQQPRLPPLQPTPTALRRPKPQGRGDDPRRRRPTPPQHPQPLPPRSPTLLPPPPPLSARHPPPLTVRRRADLSAPSPPLPAPTAPRHPGRPHTRPNVPPSPLKPLASSAQLLPTRNNSSLVLPPPPAPPSPAVATRRQRPRPSAPSSSPSTRRVPLGCPP